VKVTTRAKLLGERVAQSDTAMTVSATASKVRRKTVQVFTSASKGIGNSVGFGSWLLVRACRIGLNKLGDVKSAYEADLQCKTPGKDPEKEPSQ